MAKWWYKLASESHIHTKWMNTKTWGERVKGGK